MTVVYADFFWVSRRARHVGPDPGSDDDAADHNYQRDGQDCRFSQKNRSFSNLEAVQAGFLRFLWSAEKVMDDLPSFSMSGTDDQDVRA